jgi:hypothetical protein
VLAGQYESWILPFAVLLAVPLALLGTAGTLLGAHPRRLEGGLRDRHAGDAALAGVFDDQDRVLARLGVVPLVTASGAGAAARKSIGIAVFSGMIASTCRSARLNETRNSRPLVARLRHERRPAAALAPFLEAPGCIRVRPGRRQRV